MDALVSHDGNKTIMQKKQHQKASLAKALHQNVTQIPRFVEDLWLFCGTCRAPWQVVFRHLTKSWESKGTPTGNKALSKDC